jgi:hypothetical protein
MRAPQWRIPWSRVDSLGPRGFAAAAVAVTAFVPRALTIGHFETNDEQGWMTRSQDFGTALLHFHPSKASATTGAKATMPGVTTMWLGTLARVVWWCGKVVHLVSRRAPFEQSPAGLTLAQLFVAITTSLLLGLLVLLVWRWAGAVPAVVAGLIMATEPFFVAHGSIIHVDELTTLFGITGTVAFLLALDVPRSGAPYSRRLMVGAGALLAAAFLSKVSAVSLLPGLLFVVVAVAHAGRFGPAGARRWTEAAADVARRVWPAVATAFVVVLVAWPALWADPVRQIRLLVSSAGQADTRHVTFFLGHVTGTPGPAYYFVAAPLRMTPWFLVGSVVFGIVALWWSARARLLALIVLPQALILSLASKQFDRYALPVLATLAVVTGLGVGVAWDRLRRRVGRRIVAVAAPLALLMFVNTVVVAPWSLAYFDPMLGGSRVAEHSVLVGWGEGLEEAGAVIAKRERPACAVKVAVLYQLWKAFPCGETVTRAAKADYVVLYINDRQRLDAAALRRLRRGRLVATIRVRGLDYAEVYDTRE